MRNIYVGLFMFLVVLGVRAQVKINEYSVSNGSVTAGQSAFPDNYSETPDWVELYNTGSASVSIGGWFMSDDPAAPGKYSFPAGTAVPGNGFLRIWCSGKGSAYDAPGHVHTNFKMTQCKGEWIVLSNGGSVVDSMKLRRTQLSHSWGRSPDGSNNWKIYTTPTPNTTNTGSAYDGYAPTPLFALPAGFYGGGQNVSISAPGSGNSIYYTTNGLDPNSSSTAYTSPVSIGATTALRAVVYSSNPAYLPSFFETNTYFINENINAQYGVVSVCGTYTTDLFTSQTKIATSFEYFENNQFVVEGSGRSDKHGNDSWAYPQKGFDVEIKDDYGYTDALHHKFFVDAKMGASKRKEFQHIILKAAASDNYPQNGPGGTKKPCHMRDAFVQTYSFRKELELDGRRNKHCLVFINGDYWGIYELREAFDEDYTDYYYNQPKDSIDNLANWGGLQIRNGSDTGWTNLYNFMMANPMTVPANYAYVNSKLNLKSLIDYMVYNSYVVNSDFINWNSAWWRGRAVHGDKKKWRYWNWDMDNVYGLGENFSGLPTTDMTADPCAYQNVFQNAGPTRGHPDMLEKLLADTGFKAMYINRYADLLNTAFKCDSIMDHYNYFKSILTLEMPRHISKWGGSMTDWNNNMDTLKANILARCSYIESKIKSCYNVTGPFPITVSVDPQGAGEVKLNTIWVANPTAWTGNYFGGVNISFKARTLDSNLYVFDHWEFTAHTPGPSTTSDSVGIAFAAPENVVAKFRPVGGDVFFPTGFSPNGDGVNEVLFPLGTRGVSNIHVEIFNRWGQRVYLSDNPEAGWDGYFNGQQAQTGVYAYFITYTSATGEGKIAKGNVTLIR